MMDPFDSGLVEVKDIKEVLEIFGLDKKSYKLVEAFEKGGSLGIEDFVKKFDYDLSRKACYYAEEEGQGGQEWSREQKIEISQLQKTNFS